MDAFFVFKNELHQFSASISSNAVVSFDLDWIANEEKELFVDVSRVDDFGTHRWNPIHLRIGDNVSFLTKEAVAVDDPTETLGPEELGRLQQGIKKTMKPEKKRKPFLRDIGELGCQINDKEIFSFRLNTNNLVLINFIWDGDRGGNSMIHVCLDGSSVPTLRLPRIRFGDLVAFSSVATPDEK